jgi:hypothetical protein
LARRFRIACSSEEISQSEALEQALEQWLEKDNPFTYQKGQGGLKAIARYNSGFSQI